MSIPQDNISDLILENQDKKGTETNQLLEMVLEKLAEPNHIPELQLELLDKLIVKLEEVKTKISEPLEVELNIL